MHFPFYYPYSLICDKSAMWNDAEKKESLINCESLFYKSSIEHEILKNSQNNDIWRYNPS